MGMKTIENKVVRPEVCPNCGEDVQTDKIKTESSGKRAWQHRVCWACGESYTVEYKWNRTYITELTEEAE